MVNNEIFEVENEEVKVLGKCPVCGKVITEDDDARKIYFSETDSYEYVCEDCLDYDGYSGYRYCNYCTEINCVRPDDDFIFVWDSDQFGNPEENCLCKNVIEEWDIPKCEKCGCYCFESVLSKDGLCPDCEYDRIEEERI